jgi:excisionase family DNA binding protein
MNLEKIENRLTSIENMLVGTKDVLTFDEVVVYTKLSKSYLYKLTSTGIIPHYKPQGKLCYFNKKEIDAWLQQNRISTVKELEQKAQTLVAFKGHRKSKNKL